MRASDYYWYETVADAPADLRVRFIRRTYTHLALALLAFVTLEYLLLRWSGSDSLVYDPDQHVAASLALGASLALLLWYMIRLLGRR